MKYNFMVLFLFVCSLVSIAGCGDDSSDDFKTDESHYYGVECPRLQLESFDECLYEPSDDLGNRLTLTEKNSIDAFCQTSCNQIEYVTGFNDGKSATDISLLKGVEKIKSIDIDGMQELQNLHGLEDLKSVEKDLKIIRNPELENIEALSSLTDVGRIFKIQTNKKIKTLNGLENLREAFSIIVWVNDELRDITALNNVETLEGFGVEDNPKLPTCQAENIRDQHGLEEPDSVIKNNGTGSCD